MVQFDYAAYEEAFNAGDDDALVERYFTEDARFSGPSVDLLGREEIRAFLHQAHDGIRETMRPQVVTRSGTHVAAEIDTDFQATEDRPDFVFGPLARGELTTVKFFVTYELDAAGEKIAALRAATWKAGQGVSPAPTRITPTAAGRRAFLDYLISLSTANTERFPLFYTDGIELTLPSVGVLRGPDAVAAFYRKMFQTVRENVTAHAVFIDKHGIALEATTRITAVVDAPDFPAGPLRQGESVENDYFIHYGLHDGRINRIDLAPRGELRGPFVAESA